MTDDSGNGNTVPSSGTINVTDSVLGEGVSLPRPNGRIAATTSSGSTSNTLTRRDGAPPDKRQAMANSVASLLAAAGENMTDLREDMRDTPFRFADALLEFYQYTDDDLIKVLKNGFETPSDDVGLVVQQNVAFRTLCPHHLFPVLGYASIGYIPHKRIVGLSKLARIVDVAGAIRPDTQESICNKIASTLSSVLDARGVIVVIEATHSCMAARGVRAHEAVTKTSSVKGIFRDVPAARSEFFDLIRDRRSP